MRRVFWMTAVVLATLGGLVLLWQFRLALLLFVLSLAVTAALRPSIDFWADRGLRRSLAVLLTFVFVIALIGGLLVLVLSPLVEELEQGTNSFLSTYDTILATWPAGTPFQQQVAGQLPPSSALYDALTGERGMQVARNVLGFAQNLFSILGNLSIVLIFGVYWSIDRIHFERLWLSLLPSKERSRARTIWRHIEKGVGAYIRSELIQSLLAGILLWLGYRALGLPFPVLLAFSGALLWLIPWLGAVLAVVPPVLAGLSLGPGPAALAAGFTLIVLLLLETVVEPRVFHRERYSSLLIVLVLVVMAEAYGLLGLILAPPLAAALQILGRNLTRTSAPPEVANRVEQFQALQVRLEKMQAAAALAGEETPPAVLSLMGRLEGLLNEARAGLQSQQEDAGPALGLPTASRAASPPRGG